MLNRLHNIKHIIKIFPINNAHHVSSNNQIIPNSGEQ